MPKLGAHESISGGIHKAVERGAAVGCECVQIFTKNTNQWSAKKITDAEVRAFQEAQEEFGITTFIAHNSYLINLGSPDEVLWHRSVAAMEEEILRADRLGIPYLVMHPGSYTSATPEEGLENIIRGVQKVLKNVHGAKTRCLLENTAGQGTNLGCRWEHLAKIIAGVEGDGWRKDDLSPENPSWLGICFDTCHAFAAGYDFTTKEKYDDLMAEIDAAVGVSRICAFHINDATKICGSRVDRHAAIGDGKIGAKPFGFFLNDKRFTDHGMYLETPKGTVTLEDGTEEDLDVYNLGKLRGLLRGSRDR